MKSLYDWGETGGGGGGLPGWSAYLVCDRGSEKRTLFFALLVEVRAICAPGDFELRHTVMNRGDAATMIIISTSAATTIYHHGAMDDVYTICSMI